MKLKRYVALLLALIMLLGVLVGCAAKGQTLITLKKEKISVNTFYLYLSRLKGYLSTANAYGLSAEEDSFWDTLMEMGNDAEAFGEDLTKTMQKAIIKANIGKVYEDELQKWYEKFAKANQDGIDETEYQQLQDEYNAIVEKALKDRNALMELYGWKAEEKDTTQSGRAGAITTITEETAGRLEGIGNAQLDKVIGMSLHMESDNLTAMASSMATVAENSEYLKRLEDIADNIQNMNSLGVKIKS